MQRQVLAVALVCACGGSTPSTPRNEVPAAKPASAYADPLALVPADSDVVFRIDVAALRESPLWTKYAPYVRDFLLPGFAQCAYDPLADITVVRAGLSMASHLGVFVVRGLDRERTLGCLRSSHTETNTAVTIDGDFVTLTNKSGSVNIFTFVDATTLVMQGSKGPTKQTLSAALAIGAPLRANRDFLALDQRVAPGSALSIIAPRASSLLDRVAAPLGSHPMFMVAGVRVTDRLEASVELGLETADEASALVARWRAQVQGTPNWLDRFDVSAQGEVARFELALTEAQMQQLVTMITPTSSPPAP